MKHKHNYSKTYIFGNKKLKKCRCGKREPWHSIVKTKIKEWLYDNRYAFMILFFVGVGSMVIYLTGIYDQEGKRDLQIVENNMGTNTIYKNRSKKSFKITGTKSQNIKSEVLSLFEKEGLNTDVADCVLWQEGKYDRYAINKNKNNSYDLGILQINDISGLSRETRFDPIKSTEWAIKKIKHDKNWSAWYGFRDADCGRFGSTFK